MINNNWLENVGNLAVRGDTGVYPRYIFYAGSDNTYYGDETEISNEFLRKKINWLKTGIDSVFTSELSTVDAVGSNIYAYGLFDTSEISSGTLLLSTPSDIGSKSPNFFVEIEGEIIVRRPLV